MDSVMADPPLSAAVVICAYDEGRWQHTLEAIRSVSGQDEAPDEIILVVDHNPSLAEQLRREMPGLSVLESEEEPGASGARNTGMRHTSSDIIAFMDDDAVASKGWLSGLKELYEEDPLVIAAGGSVSASWPGPKPHWFPDEFAWVVGASYLGQPTHRAEVRNLYGGNMSLRRRNGERLLAFSQEVSRTGHRLAGGEDTLFSIELGRASPNGRIVYDPDLAVYHHVRPQYTSFRHFVRRCWSEGTSKAAVAGVVGPADALSVERRYVRHTLLPGILRRVRDSIRHRNLEQLAQGAAIAVGLLATSAGYLAGSLRSHRRQSTP